MTKDRPGTLGELRSSGYRIESVKDEMRRNLIAKLESGEPLVSRHPGLRRDGRPPGPVTRSSPSTTCSFWACAARPRRGCSASWSTCSTTPYRSSPARRSTTIRSRRSRNTPATWSPTQGDDTPIEWIGRDERYHEKLATPDVTIADLIGEVDMIKHAEGRYLSSELTMHFGLIPRTNRGIFCINELPDLAPKIQVGLFNVLEERDVQIRGYPVRLDLDLCMVFSANPEDYTNRGRIVTPLKDRIGSVIRTHYPAHARDRHRDQRPERLARASGNGSDQPGDSALHQGGRRGDRAAGPVVAACQPAVGRLGADVDRQPGKRRLQRRAAGDQSAASAGSCPGSPTWRRACRQLARQARADDVGRRRARRQADPSHHRRGGQEYLRAAPRRPRAAADRRILRVGPERRGRRLAAEQGRARADRQGARPRKRAEELAAKALPDLSDRDGREAAAASAAEFILEGLHVHNKLNKSAKAGASSYRR